MDQTDRTSLRHITAEMREAVRTQIVKEGQYASREIARSLGLRHTIIVRILKRFEAVGALRVVQSSEDMGSLTVATGSLSARIRDLNTPLW